MRRWPRCWACRAGRWNRDCRGRGRSSASASARRDRRGDACVALGDRAEGDASVAPTGLAMSSCDEQLLGAYLDGELSPEQRGQVEEHLQQCRACAKQLELLRDTSRLLREYPFQDLTDGERVRLHEAVDAAVDRPIWRIGAAIGLIAASVL